MFYRGCGTCGERWAIGKVSTCKCLDKTPKHESQSLTNEEKSFLKETWLGFKDIDKVIDTVDELLRRRTHDSNNS